MRLCYSGRSRISAMAIADEDSDIEPVRSGRGDINWGRNFANTELNPDISNATNKRVMRELFREHDVPMPELFDAEEARDMLASGYADGMIGRPDRHTKGRGLWLCKTPADVNRALRGTRRKKAATHFMEYINGDREYRVHVFKGRSIRISEKEFFINENGKKDYVTRRPSHNVRHVRKAAKEAVKALGLDFGAVDILANDDECWVLEVNSAPGLGGTMPRLYADVFRQYFNGDWEEA